VRDNSCDGFWHGKKEISQEEDQTGCLQEGTVQVAPVACGQIAGY
jgi:hypothetical protein